MLKVDLIGASGKMGRSIARLAQDSSEYSISRFLVRENSDLIGQLVNASVDKVYASINDTLHSPSDVVIDVSTPKALLENLEFANSLKLPIVICSTGIDKETEELVKGKCYEIPILFIYNTSFGVYSFFKLVEMAQSILSSHGQEAMDVELVEKHHKFKKDSPSGTAKALLNILGNSENIQVNVSRSGGIHGDHKVIFTSQDEVIEISHSALNRDLFAKGAVNAAKWLVKQPKGIYFTQDLFESHE